jgi:hypothetical protein
MNTRTFAPWPIATLGMLALLVWGCDDAGQGAGPGDGGIDDVSDGADADSHGGSDADAPDTSSDAGGGDPEPRFDWPSSQVSLELADWGILVRGSILDGPRPSPYSQSQVQGQCRLLLADLSPCDPVCEGGKVCMGGACVEQPSTSDMGMLLLGGFPGGDIGIDPSSPGVYFYQSEAHNAATAGPELTLSSSQDDMLAFSLSARRVAPFAGAEAWSDLIKARAPGEPAVLRWSNPDPAARIYIRMTTGVGTHGGIAHAEVECEGPDTGELVLPGAFLDELFSEGWSCGECGTHALWRYDAAESEGDSPIQFRVWSQAWFYFHPTVSGFE